MRKHQIDGKISVSTLMPRELMEKIKSSALANHRSLGAEIAFTLENKYSRVVLPDRPLAVIPPGGTDGQVLTRNGWRDPMAVVDGLQSDLNKIQNMMKDDLAEMTREQVKADHAPVPVTGCEKHGYPVSLPQGSVVSVSQDAKRIYDSRPAITNPISVDHQDDHEYRNAPATSESVTGTLPPPDGIVTDIHKMMPRIFRRSSIEYSGVVGLSLSDEEGHNRWTIIEENEDSLLCQRVGSDKLDRIPKEVITMRRT